MREGLFTGEDKRADVRGVAMDGEDLEFIVLQLQLTKRPQQDIRVVVCREPEERQRPAWWGRRGRGCPMLRAKFKIGETEVPEIGEMVGEEGECVQSEGKVRKR